MTRTIDSTWCHFEGYIMRSLAESRVAGALGALGISYLYEHMPYSFKGYLPDFYLPALDAFIEVKGADPTQEEIEKCERLHDQTGCPVLLVSGRPKTFPHHDCHDDYLRTEASWMPRLLVGGKWGPLSINLICRAVYRTSGKIAGERFVAAVNHPGAGPMQPIGPYAVRWIHDLSAKAGRRCRVIYDHNEPVNAEKLASPKAVSPAERTCIDFLKQRMEKAA